MGIWWSIALAAVFLFIVAAMLKPHEHEYVRVHAIYHPQSQDYDGNIYCAYYTYQREEYDFCVKCGEKVNQSKHHGKEITP